MLMGVTSKTRKILGRARILIPLAGCILMCAEPAAHASVLVELTGNGTYSMPTGTPAPTGALAYPGGGLSLNFALGRRVKLELAGNYLTRTYTSGSQNTATMVDGIVGLKFYLFRALYLDVNGFYNYYLTNPQSLTGSDYGVGAGLGLPIPLSATWAFLIRGDYHYALNALTYGGNKITPTEVVGMVGFAIGMNMLSK